MSMGIMLALSITGTSVVAFSSSNFRAAEYSADNTKSIHLAEAAEAYARSVLWNASDPTDQNAVPSGTVSLEGGTANYSGTYDSGRRDVDARRDVVNAEPGQGLRHQPHGDL